MMQMWHRSGVYILCAALKIFDNSFKIGKFSGREPLNCSYMHTMKSKYDCSVDSLRVKIDYHQKATRDGNLTKVNY